jgi:hypothetical protein
MTDGPAAEELWFRRGRGHENTYGVRLSEGRYRLTATALNSPGRVRLGAIAETVVQADGRRWISSIITRSPYRSAMRIVSGDAIRSPRFEELKARIIRVGGMWEQVLSGILIIHVPPESGLDPRAEIEALMAGVAFDE